MDPAQDCCGVGDRPIVTVSLDWNLTPAHAVAALCFNCVIHVPTWSVAALRDHAWHVGMTVLESDGRWKWKVQESRQEL